MDSMNRDTQKPKKAKVPPADLAEEARPSYGRGRPPGSKTAEPSPYTKRLAVAVTPEQYRDVMRVIGQRKAADPDLPGRWGASDLIREVLEKSGIVKPAK